MLILHDSDAAGRWSTAEPSDPDREDRRSVQGNDPNQAIEEILRGSFDLHVHAGPDSMHARRLDALDTARAAQEAEMGGFVLKSHEYPTAPLARLLSRVYPGLSVVGSIALNIQVGGLNPHAVETAVGNGARVVWMPTHSARARGAATGIAILDDRGRPLPEVREVLEVVAGRDMVLASGHISPVEAVALFEAAREAGVSRMLATHPAGTASVEQLRQMVAAGAYIEHTFLSCMPTRGRTAPEELVASIRRHGVDGSVVTTDFGQPANPPPAEGMRMAIATLLDAGMTADEVSRLVKANPMELLGG